MTVNELMEKCGLKAVSLPEPEREIDGCYIGDLLSWVMGRAEESNVWITIMSNINIIAVATLTDVSCIILAEGVTVEDDIINVAKEKGVNILLSEKRTYETALAVHELI